MIFLHTVVLPELVPPTMPIMYGLLTTPFDVTPEFIALIDGILKDELIKLCRNSSIDWKTPVYVRITSHPAFFVDTFGFNCDS